MLADEINRTPPKTQSALLEAMQEHRVTVQGKTYALEEPFFVFATQNPIELEGTYPLPEAQLDRFMFDIVIDYLPEDEEMEVVAATTATQDLRFERAVTGADIVAFQRLVRRVPVADEVIRYAVDLARASRPSAPRPARVREEVGRLRRQRARRAVPHPGRQGARADARPLPRELRRHPRPGPSRASATASSPTSTPSRSGSRKTTIVEQLLGRRPHPAVADVAEETPRCAAPQPRGDAPASRFLDPRGPRADRQPRAARAHGRRRLHQRPAPLALPRAARSTSPSTAPTCPATTSGASTGGSSAAPTAST